MTGRIPVQRQAECFRHNRGVFQADSLHQVALLEAHLSFGGIHLVVLTVITPRVAAEACNLFVNTSYNQQVS